MDREVARLAERQHGVVALFQLNELGLAASAVRSRIEVGRLHQLQQGVYAVGHPLVTLKGEWMAAVLACGPGAVLSHGSAAALWGLLPADGKPSIDVTAPNRRGRKPRGITAHRDGALHPNDCTQMGGVPCTSVARTLLDVAGQRGMRMLRSAVGEAEVLRLLDHKAVWEVIERCRGRRGVARLRQIMSELDPQVQMTRSELERRVIALCTRSNLPPPEVNARLNLPGGEVVVDFLWRDSCLILEADGRRYHDTASAFERDRRRDQHLKVAGWQVIRCTWRQVVDEPTALSHTLRTLLDRGRRDQNVQIADGMVPSAREGWRRDRNVHM